MPNYQKMYFELFNHITNVIEYLQGAQQDAEDEYIEDDEPISIKDYLLKDDEK